jgi:thiamine biosynthesis lipoprotein
MRIILNSCKDNGLQPSAPVPIPPSSSSQRSRRLRICLGTFVAVEATSISTSAAEAAIEAAFTALGDVAKRMHPKAEGSDLSRINTARLQAPVQVHPSTAYLLDFARRLHLLTDGVFDPCLPTQAGRLTDLEITSDEVVCHAPVALDFGGFAKGYAVDCAIQVLLRHGCMAGLVNAGGDLRVFGCDNDPILVRGPEGQLREITLSNAALAVSQASSRERPAEHQGYYVRSALGGDVALATPYAAVVAEEAVVADALAKCVLLCPAGATAATLREFNATQLVYQ